MKSQLISAPKFFGILAAVLFIGSLTGCQKEYLENGTAFSPEKLTTAKAGTAVSNFMIITSSETLPEGFESKLSAYGRVIRSIPEIGIVVIKPKSVSIVAKISKVDGVLAVVPDLMAKWIDPVEFIIEANPPSIADNEPYSRLQWGLDAIDAPEAWNAGYTGGGARVFILDSGIDAAHPDLAPNLNTTLCTSFVPDEDFNVDNGFYFHHGTHVAGIIAAANNADGCIGVAPDAEITAVKVLSEYTGSGAFSWINAGIVYAANNGADVINMSLGATFNRNGFYLDDNDVLQKIAAVYMQSLILAQQRAVNYAYRKGAVIVTSAGNDGYNFDGNASIFTIPAELQNVIAVSATAPDYWYNDLVTGNPDSFLDVPASYTSFGRSLVDIAAPGGDFDFYPQTNYHYDMVLSTISGGWGWAAGTSMASPHVAGVAALIIAGNDGRMSPAEVTKQLFNSADKIDGNGISAYYGNGRVNAFRATNDQ